MPRQLSLSRDNGDVPSSVRAMKAGALEFLLNLLMIRSFYEQLMLPSRRIVKRG